MRDNQEMANILCNSNLATTDQVNAVWGDITEAKDIGQILVERGVLLPKVYTDLVDYIDSLHPENVMIQPDLIPPVMSPVEDASAIIRTPEESNMSIDEQIQSHGAVGGGDALIIEDPFDLAEEPNEPSQPAEEIPHGEANVPGEGLIVDLGDVDPYNEEEHLEEGVPNSTENTFFTESTTGDLPHQMVKEPNNAPKVMEALQNHSGGASQEASILEDSYESADDAFSSLQNSSTSAEDSSVAFDETIEHILEPIGSPNDLEVEQAQPTTPEQPQMAPVVEQAQATPAPEQLQATPITEQPQVMEAEQTQPVSAPAVNPQPQTAPQAVAVATEEESDKLPAMEPESREVPPLQIMIPEAVTPQHSLDEILLFARNNSVSDLHLIPGAPITMRHFTSLHGMSQEPLTAERIKEMLLASLPEKYMDELRQNGDTEFVYTISGGGRFRVTVMNCRTGWSFTARIIPFSILSFDEIGLSESAYAVTKWA